ncbi:MAG: hypothetical protein AAFR61_13100 [Bacteroidota bacterium]
MKHYVPLLWIALFSVSFTACKATKKAYKKGDYETAVFNSVDRLRKSPNNKKAIETLQAAYPDLLEYFQEKIANAKRSGNQMRWEEVAGYYSVLNRIYDEVQRAPGARDVLPEVKNFQPEYQVAATNAAEARYLLGEQALTQGKAGNRESAKEAYYHFQTALDYRNPFKDAQQKMEEAQFEATLFVRIDPIPMHSRTLSLTNEFFENQMTEFIRSRPTSPFIQFYSGKDGDLSEDGPDHVIRMIFDDFVVGQAYVKETVLQRQKDDVVVGTVKVTEDSTADVLGTVKAEVHQFQKEISSSGLLNFEVIDTRTNSLMTQRKFPGTFIYYDQWGFYSGDKRALTTEDNQFCRKRNPAPDPSPQTLFIEFTKPIFDQVTSFVGSYYRDF